MGKHLVLKEKKNGNISNSSDSEDMSTSKALRTRSDLSPMLVREKIRRRLMRSNETWLKFDGNLNELKKCVLKVVDIIDECRNIAKLERHGNDELLNVLQDNSIAVTCKTNVVNPMIKGLPLKKVTITLQRLAPIDVQLYDRHMTVSTSGALQQSSNSLRLQTSRSQSIQPSPSSSALTRSHSSHANGSISEL